MTPEHKIFIGSELSSPPSRYYTVMIRRSIRAALKAEGVRVPCEVSVLLTDDAGIRQINLEQRNIDAPTDVLSFPMFEYRPGHPPVDSRDADPGTGRIPLGDMVLSMERVFAQAAGYGHSRARELSYLTIHSTLHLLGYDHLDEGPEKVRMRAREEAIWSALRPNKGS